MTYTELKEKYRDSCNLIIERKIKDAFDMLYELSDHCSNTDYKEKLKNNFDTFRNILKYTFEYNDDPEKENVYRHLQKSLIELASDIKEDIITGKKMLGYYFRRFDLPGTIGSKEEALNLVDNLSFQREYESLMGSLKENKQKKKESADYKTSILKLFNLIWFTNKPKEAEIQLVKNICESQSLPWYDKCLLVSALTLSVLRYFDSEKCLLLISFYETKEEHLWQRALIGFVITLYKYDTRIFLYPEIINRIKAIQSKEFQKNIESILLQFLKAKETEKVTKKVREEIIPEVLKMKSKLDDKLDLENMLSSNIFEEKNPEWETFFKDSPDVYEKFEEFSMMQMEGSDVFLSAFALLKRFNFFNEISNWFIPFYKENETIKESIVSDDRKFDPNQFIEGLERSSFLCNSDKYSFCLNVKYMPELQKSMMMEMFNMELKAMNEIAKEDEKISSAAKNKTAFTQYFQDLYRFFKLHPLKNEFDDIFLLEIDFIHSFSMNLLIENPLIKRNIAEYYLEKKYYKNALIIFQNLESKESQRELYEKIAFCYQQLGDFNTAIDYYHKAELFDKNQLWIIKQIGYCYRKIKNYSKALDYYRQAEKLEPDNLQIQAFLGHIYMDTEDFESALQYYFKVEYLNPDNHKVQRPIAWCSFVLSKFDTAEKYFKKCIAKDENKNDYLNLGHIFWCMNEKKKAIEYYKKSLIKSGNDISWIENVFKDDGRYLIQHGINKLEIALILDYLKIDLNK